MSASVTRYSLCPCPVHQSLLLKRYELEVQESSRIVTEVVELIGCAQFIMPYAVGAIMQLLLRLSDIIMRSKCA
jgi:hypothetical protein